MAPHSSTLDWKIPWMEEPGGLRSMGSLKVGHDWVTSLSLFTFMHWRRKRQPTPVFLPGEPQGRGSLVGLLLWVEKIFGIINVRQFDLLGKLKTYVAKIYIGQSQFHAWNLTTKEVISDHLGTARSVVCISTSARESVFIFSRDVDSLSNSVKDS